MSPKSRIQDKDGKRFGVVRFFSILGLVAVAFVFIAACTRMTDRMAAEDEVLDAARVLYGAMEDYSLRIGTYPSSGDPLEETFDRKSLEPLIREGSLLSADRVTGSLANERIEIYCSPDLPTRNHDFFAVLVSARNPEVKALVADTDEYTGLEGRDMRGIFILRGGRWVPRNL